MKKKAKCPACKGTGIQKIEMDDFFGKHIGTFEVDCVVCNGEKVIEPWFAKEIKSRIKSGASGPGVNKKENE